jgi:hypothetical protein
MQTQFVNTVAPVASAPPQPPVYQTVPIINYDDYCLERFKAIARQYEIRPDFCQKLRQLEGYEIIILCDDSGSMSSIVDDNKDPFGKKITRWDELKNTVSLMVEIATTLDKNGVDLYFLNRASMHNVSSSQQIQIAFQHPPNGYTPLTQALDRILEEKKDIIREKKLLLIIATDGQPTNYKGDIDTQSFINKLSNRPKNIFVSILACTDDNDSIGYLNKIDRMVPGIDVIDDFRSETREIQRFQGKNFKFSFGDYVVKALLGPIDPYFDNLDETSGNCCVIS